MASKVIGHMQCPECDFPDAEVKTTKNPDLLHRYCPDCSAQYFARTVQASDRLRAKMRPYGTVQEPEAPAAAAIQQQTGGKSALDFLTGK